MILGSSTIRLWAGLGLFYLMTAAEARDSPLLGSDIRGQERDMSGQGSMLQYLPSRKGAPASSAVRVGNVLYLSGLLGSGTDGRIVGDILAQTHAMMGRLQEVLARNDSSMGNVLHCTLITTDIHKLPLVNEVYIQYFPIDRLPARTAFEASGLAADALVEIACTAAVNQPAMR